MNGYLARVTICCGTTSVDRGLYSSIVIVPFCARTAAGTRANASLYMDWMFFEQCNYSMPQLLGKSHAIVRRSARSGHRIADAHRHAARLDDSRSERQHFTRPLQGHRNQRHPGLDGDECSAFLEIPHLAGPRAPALRKDQQGDSLIPDNLRRQSHGLHCRTRILARHLDVAGAAKVPSQKWNLKQAPLG